MPCSVSNLDFPKFSLLVLLRSIVFRDAHQTTKKIKLSSAYCNEPRIQTVQNSYTQKALKLHTQTWQVQNWQFWEVQLASPCLQKSRHYFGYNREDGLARICYMRNDVYGGDYEVCLAKRNTFPLWVTQFIWYLNSVFHSTGNYLQSIVLCANS